MRSWRATGLLSLVGFGLRAAVALWAAGRFPASADGQYYQKLAVRLAEGQGYTWPWPDGVVTYAAHYPVGYPAMLAVLYALFGPSLTVAMFFNAVVGGLGVGAAHRIALRRATPRMAVAGAVAVALHPALVFYTPAIMTEGITACLLLIAFAVLLEVKRRWVSLVLGGVLLGVATLVRPQCILLAPFLGALHPAATSVPKRAMSAAAVLVVALLCCAPWTARNCVHMNRCALVSVNGGWNLLIGTQTDQGAWTELDVPEECRNVFDEAGKDSCFERAAKASIAAHPGTWLAKAPNKLAVTFDYFGAAPFYLHLANADVFSDEAKFRLGAFETVVARLLLALALLVATRLATAMTATRPARVAWLCLGLVALGFAFSRHAWPAYGVLAVLGARVSKDEPLFGFASAVLLTTMAIHAAFFGAGRYGLVVVPFVTLMAFARPLRDANVFVMLRGPSSVGQSPAASASKRREESPSSTEYGAG